MNLSNPKFVENAVCAALTRKGILKLLQSKTIKQMVSLCTRKGGVGLAAIQVGILQKFFVAYRPDIKVKGQTNMGSWCVFMNPEYIPENKKETYTTKEGCLTYGKDNLYKVKRYKKIKASWDELDGANNVFRVTQIIDSEFSQIFQHE